MVGGGSASCPTWSGPFVPTPQCAEIKCDPDESLVDAAAPPPDAFAAGFRTQNSAFRIRPPPSTVYCLPSTTHKKSPQNMQNASKTLQNTLKSAPNRVQTRSKSIQNRSKIARHPPTKMIAPPRPRHSEFRTLNSEFVSPRPRHITTVRTPITPHPPPAKNNFPANSRPFPHLQTPPSTPVRTNMVLHPLYRKADNAPPDHSTHSCPFVLICGPSPSSIPSLAKNLRIFLPENPCHTEPKESIELTRRK